MKELTDRLEAAAGSDRELDADIFCAVTPGSEKHGLSGGGWVSSGPDKAVNPAPQYTGSMDAAVTLMPEGVVSHGYQTDDMHGGYRAHCYLDRHSFATPYAFASGSVSPAIALCIVAIKGRSLLLGSQD